MSHFEDIVSDNLDQRWRQYTCFKPTATPVRCSDGAALSVQASRRHACMPKRDRGPYTTLEVLFAGDAGPPEWERYLCAGVYNNVPVETICEYIRQHGGEIERRH